MRRPVPTSDRLLTNLDFHPRIGLRAAETCGQSSWVDAASSVLMNPRLVSNLNFFFFLSLITGLVLSSIPQPGRKDVM